MSVTVEVLKQAFENIRRAKIKLDENSDNEFISVSHWGMHRVPKDTDLKEDK